MARTLPPNPNLDHLKKQAKALLAALRRRNPAAKLAEAQRAIAKTYGFRDWAGIKEHVEVLSTAKGAAAASAVSQLAGVWALNPDETQEFADEAFERAIIVDASTLAHDGYPAVSRAMVFDRIETSRAAAEEALMSGA